MKYTFFLQIVFVIIRHGADYLMTHGFQVYMAINTLRARQDGRHFCRRRFIFLQWKLLNFKENFIEIWSLGSNWQYGRVDSDNGWVSQHGSCIYLKTLALAWRLKCTSDTLGPDRPMDSCFFINKLKKSVFSQHRLWLKSMWQKDEELVQMSYWCSDPKYNMWSTWVLTFIIGLQLTHWS